MFLGRTEGNAGPVTAVHSHKQLRVLAARKCNGTNMRAHYASECCLHCEASEILQYRRDRKHDRRRLIRAANRGYMPSYDVQHLREMGAGSFYV